MRKSNVIPILDSNSGSESRPLRADAAANRQRLLATASTLFDAQGVAHVHMEHIAQNAGVGKGTLYRHFPSKGDLCLALLDGAFRDFQNEVLEELRHGMENEASHLDLLAGFLAAYADYMDRHMPLMCEIQRDGVDTLHSPAPHIWLSMTIRGLLEAAQTAGEVGAGLDLPVITELLMGPYTAQHFRFMRERHGFSASRIAAGQASMVVNLCG